VIRISSLFRVRYWDFGFCALSCFELCGRNKGELLKNKQIALGVLLAAWSTVAWPLPGIGRDAQEDQGIEYIHPRYLESAPPFSFPGPDRRPVGIPLIFARMSRVPSKKQLGIDLKHKLGCQHDREPNRYGGVLARWISIASRPLLPFRGRKSDFSLMTFADGGGLLTKSDLKLGAVADLADKRIAVIPGTTTETALQKFLKEEFVSVKYVPVKKSPGRARGDRTEYRQSEARRISFESPRARSECPRPRRMLQLNPFSIAASPSR